MFADKFRQDYIVEKEQIPTSTPATFETFRVALVAACEDTFGTPPNIPRQVIMCAHSAFETGEWRSMMNNNVGNAKARPGQGRDYTYFPTKEYLPTQAAQLAVKASTDAAPCKVVGTSGDKTIVQFLPKHPVCCFRAFDTLAAGMSDHLILLGGRYKAAFDFADKGDVTGFVTSIHSNGYFTGNLVDYIAGVNRYFDKFACAKLGIPFDQGSIKMFQKSVGLVDDGIIGPKTRAKLQEGLLNLS